MAWGEVQTNWQGVDGLITPKTPIVTSTHIAVAKKFLKLYSFFLEGEEK